MELTGKTVMLVGGAGLIGSHIVDQLLKTNVGKIKIFDNFSRGTLANIELACRDPRVQIVKGDITRIEEIESACEGVDGVFLLAALWLLQCAENPRQAVDINVVGNFNVLEACRKAQVKRLVFSSSASVYGNTLTPRMSEDHPLNNRTFYGATKVALEQMVRSYYEMHKLPYVALRYFNVYGPRQDYKNAYVSVIMKVLDRIDAGLPPIVMGDGSQAYDFIYVKDIARANILAMQSEVVDESFNICMGKKTSIKELVHQLLKLTNTVGEIEYKPASQVFVTDRVGDPAGAYEKLGFKASIELSEGLQELIVWRKERIERDKELGDSRQ